MKILRQVAIIFLITFSGELLATVIPLPVPGSIYALLILLILLFSHIIKEGQIVETADYLLGNMAIFFIPACVGLMEHIELLKNAWWQIILVSTVSFFLTFIASGATVSLMIKLIEKKATK